MTRTLLTLLVFLLQQYIFSQPAAKEPALAIPENLTHSTIGISSFIKEHYATDTARIRAIFVWVANNINYDIEKFINRSLEVQSVAEVLRTRMAVCGGYADLFNELCGQCNIPSVVVGGYTKQYGLISTTSHAWVAVELNKKWYLFDPTWAAGSVKDNKFNKGFSNTYYKLSPDLMIKDHMPFDPMYQFLEYTLSNKEFIDGNINTANRKTVFNYSDTLHNYNLLSKEDKTRSEMRRIQNNGIENEVIKKRVDYLARLTEGFTSKTGFEQAMNLYKRSIELFNEYITYKNKQFATVEVKVIKLMIDSISYHVNQSWSMLGTTVARDETNRLAIRSAYQELERFQNRVNKEKEFVTTYLNTDVSLRKQLFYKN